MQYMTLLFIVLMDKLKEILAKSKPQQKLVNNR